MPGLRLEDEAPAASQARLRTLVSENGLRARTDAECAELYRLDQLPRTLTVTLGKKAVVIEPSFGHAMRACVESVAVPLAEFRRDFATDGLLRQVLADW